MSRLITNDMKTEREWDAKKYPNNIKFQDENGNLIKYTIEYEDPKIGNTTDSYPILCKTSDNWVMQIRFFDKGLKEEISDVTNEFIGKINEVFTEGESLIEFIQSGTHGT